jgi:hypothetical protein
VYLSAEALQIGLFGYAFAIIFVSAMSQKLFWLLIFLSVTLHGLTRQAHQPPPAQAPPVRRRRPQPVTTS